MIRIKKIATKKAEVSWDTGLDFKYLSLLDDMIKHRNELITKNNGGQKQ